MENIANSVIAHAEYSRYEIPDYPQHECTNSWPPQWIDGKFVELILHPVERLAECIRGQSAKDSEKQIEGQRVENAEIHGADRKHRTRSQQTHVHGRCQCAGDDQGNKGPRLELE